MGALIILLGIIQAGGWAENPVSVRSHPGGLTITVASQESVATNALLVPAPEGALPTVTFSTNCRWSFGRVMKAGGIDVVPLIVFREGKDNAEIELRFAQPSEEGVASSPMGLLLFPWLSGDNEGDDEIGYLIIVPDDFYENVLPLARWKELKGFKVWVKKTSETGTQREEIRSFIRNAYLTWRPTPAYVLLVGAINKIPAFPTPGATSCVTDHPYSLVDGDDYLADLFVGRLPAANVSELDCIVAKIVNYESNPYVVEDTTWFHRALMVGTSYQEGGTPAVTALVTKRRIREQLLARGFQMVDTVFYPPTLSGRGPVDSAVNSGVLFVNGRGWGQTRMWNYPQFEINDVYNLNNGWKLPIVTSLYCGTGNYGANPCFGEAWLRAGTPTAPKGGVGFWGTSYTGTSTRWNNCMDYGIYRAIFDRNITTLGPAMYSGKLEQLINFPLPQDSFDLVLYFHTYNLLGDPAMEMWTTVPREIAVFYPSVYCVGNTSFPVEVRDIYGNPVENALVCLHKRGEVHLVKRTNSSGMAQFVITTTTPETLYVTVTGKHLKPHLGYSRGETRGALVGISRYDPESLFPGSLASIAVTLKNFGGAQTVEGIRATLSALDSFSTVRDSIREYGSLSPGEENTAEPFFVAVAPSCTSGQMVAFRLVITSGDSVWTTGFSLAIRGPTITVTGLTVYDTNGVLDPGETVELSVRVQNRGATDARDVLGVLRSSNSWAIAMVDSLGSFGTVAAGDSGENSIDRFVVRAAPGIGIGRKFLLWIVLRGSDGFQQSVGFPITVGQLVSGAPTGPDSYGYYGYDDTDTGYQERPRFDWVEIDPGQGGVGTHLELGNDQARPVDLPFTFKFYGSEYRTISIADNGYIAMGNTTYSEQYNWHIPSAQGPDGLIAVFWDDFRVDTMGAPGVFYHYDEENHRFIVEWSRVFHVHGFRRPSIGEQQTFQVILYDPAFYSTKTGDGVIVCQFLYVQNDDTLWGDSHNCATVGIQHPSHNDGLEWTFAGNYPLTAAEVVPQRAIKFITNPPDTFTFLNEMANERFMQKFEVRPNIARKDVAFHIRGVDIGVVQVFDIAGREVRRFEINDGWKDGCLHWDLKDMESQFVSAGVYLIKLTGLATTGKISVNKVVVIVR
ncbi:MAG: C25 family cysteine peptidase [bacterium]